MGKTSSGMKAQGGHERRLGVAPELYSTSPPAGAPTEGAPERPKTPS